MYVTVRRLRKGPSCSILAPYSAISCSHCESTQLLPSWPIKIGISGGRRPSRVIRNRYLKPEIRELNMARAGIESTLTSRKAHSSTQLHSLDMETSVCRSILVGSRVSSPRRTETVQAWEHSTLYACQKPLEVMIGLRAPYRRLNDCLMARLA